MQGIHSRQKEKHERALILSELLKDAQKDQTRWVVVMPGISVPTATIYSAEAWTGAP